MAYVALDHNAQDRFYDTANRAVVAENLLHVMGSWFLAMAFCFALLRIIRDILALEAPEMNQGYGRDGRSWTSVLYYLGEQQLVDLHGGVGSYQVANLIRPVSAL